MPTFRDDLHLGHSVPMVDTEDIVDGAITEPKLADDSVSTRTIQDGAVTEPKIAEKAITEPKLADAAVSTRTIKFRAVTESKIGDSAVSTRTIQNGAVTNPKIANGAVSMNKLDNETQTLIQRGADSSWTPMGDYDVDALYYANDLVFDPETNSSYLSLRADNMGHAVTDETWWMKVVDGSYANVVEEELQQLVDSISEGTQQQVEELNEALEALEAQADQSRQDIQDIVDSLAVVQTTGQSASAVMSQKAVTDSLVGTAISYDNFQSGLAADNVQNVIDEELVSSNVQNFALSVTNPNILIFPFPFAVGKEYSITVRRTGGDSLCTFHSYSNISGSGVVNLIRLEQGETEKTETFIATSNQYFGMWSSSGTVSAEVSIEWREGSRLDNDFYEETQVVKETFFDCRNTNNTGGTNFAISTIKGQTYRYRVTFPSSVGWDGGMMADTSGYNIRQKGSVIASETKGSNIIRTFEITCEDNYGGFRSYINGNGSTIIEFSKLETEICRANRVDALDQRVSSVEEELKDEIIIRTDTNITTKTNTHSDFTYVNISLGSTYVVTCVVDNPLTAGCGVLLKKDPVTANTGEITLSSLSAGFTGTKITRYTPISSTNYKYLCVWSSVAGNNIRVTIEELAKGDIVKRLDALESNLDPQNFGAVYDGSIDCSPALQACLDLGGNIVINGRGTCLLDSSVYIKKSNTHLTIGEGITIVRGSNVSGALIRNEASTFPYDDERVNSNILDKIVIEGGTINLANRGNLAIFLCDISNFELRNIKIKNSSGFGLLFANVYGFNVDNVVFDYSNPAINTDGIHFRGDIKDGVIQHIYGNTGDDLVSLTPTGDYNTGGKDTRRGILDNVVVRDLFGKDSMCAVKLNTGNDTPMKKIVIDGIYGHYTYNPISIGNWMESAVFEDILIKDIHCTCDNQTNMSFEGYIRIADWKSGNTTVIKNLSIVDSYIKVTHSMNIIRNVGHTINNLMLSNIIVDVDDISLSSRSILNGGTINKLIANNVLVKAPATASKFNKFFNCSTMSKALLSNCDLYVNSLGTANTLYTSNTLVNDNEI